MSDNGSQAGGDGGEGQAPKEVKPKTDDNSLNIKIVSTDGSEVFFKIKKTTRLNKLKSAYADRVGAEVGAIRLLFDGTRILDDQTAADLELEDGDSLEVLLEQVGGC